MRNGNKGKTRKTETYNRALRVLARMRRTEASLSAAAREEHIDPRTVRKYLGADLRGFTEGQVRPSKADRRRRNMLIPTEQGASPIIVRGSREATLLGRYMSAVGRYLRTGDAELLGEFEGKSIGGHLLITDTDILNHLAQAGALQLDEIYALPESSS